MKLLLRLLVVALIVIGTSVGFMVGIGRPNASANPIETEVIDAKTNSRGNMTAVRRYGNYGGGFLYTEVRIEIVIKQANQECVVYSRGLGERENPEYEWLPHEDTLSIKDSLGDAAPAIIRRCFSVQLKIAEMDKVSG